MFISNVCESIYQSLQVPHTQEQSGAWGMTMDTPGQRWPQASLARQWACGCVPPLGGGQGHYWHTAQNVPVPCSELLRTKPGSPFLFQEAGRGRIQLPFVWGHPHPQALAHPPLLACDP